MVGNYVTTWVRQKDNTYKWSYDVAGRDGEFVGDSVGLHPVIVMLALLVGSGLFGFLGLLLGVPVAASLMVLIDEAVRRFQASDWFQADA